jgi:hypothetical protein
LEHAGIIGAAITAMVFSGFIERNAGIRGRGAWSSIPPASPSRTRSGKTSLGTISGVIPGSCTVAVLFKEEARRSAMNFARLPEAAAVEKGSRG